MTIKAQILDDKGEQQWTQDVGYTKNSYLE